MAPHVPDEKSVRLSGREANPDGLPSGPVEGKPPEPHDAGEGGPEGVGETPRDPAADRRWDTAVPWAA